MKHALNKKRRIIIYVPLNEIYSSEIDNIELGG